jgi:hypothetical protein
MTTIVFLGPSLPMSEARAILPQARFMPPAARGDVYRVARDETPAAIALIDGVFHRQRAVWHREILWALSRGIAVIGAASMGALRAVELAAYGMRGIGHVHAAFATGRLEPYEDPIDDDGEVAVAHAPVELGAAPLTLALIDLRCAFAAEAGTGMITPAQCRALAAASAAVFFAERTPERVHALVDAADLDARARAALHARLDAPDFSTKRADACAALHALARGDATPASPRVVLEPALVWEHFRQAQDPDDVEALRDELRLLPEAWPRLRDFAVVPAGLHDRLRARAARKQALLGPRAASTRISQARALRLLAGFARRAAGDGIAQPGTAALVAATMCRDEAELVAILDREERFAATMLAGAERA